jgi:adenosylcobinamide-GDP ribazoletransferase
VVQQIYADLKSSILFLSRLPMSFSLHAPLPDFTRTPWAFAIAGMVIALPAAIILWGTVVTGLTPLLAAILATATMMMVTGALHEDGLADMVDGFWGGHSKTRKLEIMRDSTIGTYGVLALIIAVCLRIALLWQLLTVLGALPAALVLIAAAGLSRAAMLQPWALLPAARSSKDNDKDSSGKDTSGLSARYGVPGRKILALSHLAALPAMALLVWTCGWIPAVLGLVLFQMFVLAVMRLSHRHIEGHTGDTLGATQQLSELGLLLGLIWTM